MVRRPGTGDTTLVLLHGLGSNEHDLISLAEMFAPEIEVVSFRAPLPYGPGFSWFPIEFDEHGIRVDGVQCLDAIDRLLGELQILRDQTSKLIVGGFSQGAIMTSGVLAKEPAMLNGAVMMSGRYLPAFFDAAEQDIEPALPMLVQHGIYDPVLPIEGARELRGALVELGYAPEYREYPMGHEVSQSSLADLNDWLSRQIA